MTISWFIAFHCKLRECIIWIAALRLAVIRFRMRSFSRLCSLQAPWILGFYSFCCAIRFISIKFDCFTFSVRTFSKNHFICTRNLKHIAFPKVNCKWPLKGICQFLYRLTVKSIHSYANQPTFGKLISSFLVFTLFRCLFLFLNFKYSGQCSFKRRKFEDFPEIWNWSNLSEYLLLD